jgi:hypothetical protein
MSFQNSYYLHYCPPFSNFERFTNCPAALDGGLGDGKRRIV